MKFDPETGDNIYDVPAELSPVIEYLTNRDHSRGEALLAIYRVTERFRDYLPDDVAWNRAMMSMINEIEDLVPEDLRPL